MAGVMNGLDQSLAHESGCGNRAVQASMMDHLDYGIDAAALFADQSRPRASELYFAGRIRPIPQLVFQALKMKPILLTRRRPARKEKAGQSLGCLRQDQKSVTHGRGAEPFVAGNQILSGTADPLGSSDI